MFHVEQLTLRVLAVNAKLPIAVLLSPVVYYGNIGKHSLKPLLGLALSIKIIFFMLFQTAFRVFSFGIMRA